MIGLISYFAFFLTVALIFGIVTLGLDLQWGKTGIFNAGVVGFYAIGAYGFAILTAPASPAFLGNFGLPWGIGILGAMLISAFAALLVGLATIRLRDDYLSVASFGIAVTIQLIVTNWQPMTGGTMGIGQLPNPTRGLFEFRLWNGLAYLALVATVLALVCYALTRMTRSPWGRVLRAMREDEPAARTLGKNTVAFRLQCFVIGSTLMGLGGALYASFTGFVSPADFLPIVTFLVWTMLIVGGSGNAHGALLGAILVWGIWSMLGAAIARFLPVGLQAQAGAVQAIFIGVVLVLVLLYRPRGLVGEAPTTSRSSR